ncbi:hypothetical protein OC846_000744 [Tilletia horrida]|uniref:Uncharacterized protein n=1 Tax=Tilletia horrida TaxID=155126 RepID=A0AAN6JTN2_9BASI|nr:hypothetical protein OC846_000744 [Tilletia horrida]
MNHQADQTEAQQELLADELGAFALFDGDEHGDSVNGSPTEHAESSKQARVRRAVEQAKREFEPVREDHSWFITQELLQLLHVQLEQQPYEDAEDQWQDGPVVQIVSKQLDDYIHRQFTEDKRASHKLDWTLSALYANGCLKAALTLAIALLRTVDWSSNIATFTTPNPSSDLTTWPIPTDPGTDSTINHTEDKTSKKGKERIKSNLFAYDKEAHDVALRCLIKLLPRLCGEYDRQTDEVTRLAWLIACQSSRLAAQEGLREGVWDGSHEVSEGWKKVHWTNTPGLALSLGDLCSQLKHWRGAASAYALYIGTRGPLRIAARSTARALAQLAATVPEDSQSTTSAQKTAITSLSQAFASAYIGATPPQNRPVAIQEVKAGQLLPISDLPESPNSEAVDESSKEATESDEMVLRDLIQADVLAPESVIALIRCGPTKRTSMAQCVQRLAHFLSGSGTDGLEDEDDGQIQIRSVRTL